MSLATSSADSWTAAWDAALDALELEGDDVERLLRNRSSDDVERAITSPSFQPPAGLGPLPLELADRARRLLARQLELSSELTAAMHSNRQHAMLVARLNRSASDPRPVFVDRAD